MATQRNKTFQPVPPSSRYRNSIMNGANSRNISIYPMQTPNYSRFTQRPNSLYDKTFGTVQSPRKNLYRIAKNPNRRRSLEVSRISKMDQREQYRRLIEQYQKTTLKETSFIFGLSHGRKTEAPKVLEKSVIDLTEKSPSEDSVPKSVVDRNGESCNLNQNVGKHFTARKLDTDKPLTTNNAKENIPSLEDRQINVRKPKKLLSDLDLSCPYLSKDFLPDLINSYSRRERLRKAEECEAETRARLLREKREAKDALLAEVLQKKLQLQEKKVEDAKLVELTLEMNEAINDALVPYPAHEVLSEQFNITITREHISTLFGLNWLNDEVINFYMELIVQRSKERDNLPSVHAMNTFFYPRLSTQSYSSVRRWTKRVDIFSKDIVLFPIHLGVHWCMAIANFLTNEIQYYDSMGGHNADCLQTLKGYLISEHKDKKKSDYDVSDWKLISMTGIPQQMNGSDCGVFTCKFAEYATFKAALSFTQGNMPYFRRAMVWEILNKQLLR